MLVEYPLPSCGPRLIIISVLYILEMCKSRADDSKEKLNLIDASTFNQLQTFTDCQQLWNDLKYSTVDLKPSKISEKVCLHLPETFYVYTFN
jgi:hypothetical protein